MRRNVGQLVVQSLEGAASAEAKSDAAGAEQELAVTQAYLPLNSLNLALLFPSCSSLVFFFSFCGLYFVFMAPRGDSHGGLRSSREVMANLSSSAIANPGERITVCLHLAH